MSGTYFEYKCVNWYSAGWTEYPWSDDYIETHGGKVPVKDEKADDAEGADEETETKDEDEDEAEEEPEDDQSPFKEFEDGDEAIPDKN